MKKLNNPLELIEELKVDQERKLLETGRKFVPTLTAEDMLQPCDYDDLKNNPIFAYEEGYFHAILAIEASLRSLLKQP